MCQLWRRVERPFLLGSDPHAATFGAGPSDYQSIQPPAAVMELAGDRKDGLNPTLRLNTNQEKTFLKDRPSNWEAVALTLNNMPLKTLGLKSRQKLK